MKRGVWNEHAVNRGRAQEVVTDGESRAMCMVRCELGQVHVRLLERRIEHGTFAADRADGLGMEAKEPRSIASHSHAPNRCRRSC